MQNDKNKWVDDVLNSTDGMSRAYVPDMGDDILSKLNSSESLLIDKADTGLIWRMAASLILLLALNSLTVYSYQSRMSDVHRQPASPDVTGIFGVSPGGNNDPGAAIFGN